MTAALKSQLDTVLAPCPFCGERVVWHAGSDNENWAGATCKFCGVTLDDQDAGCMDRVAEKWNRRAAVGGEAVAWQERFRKAYFDQYQNTVNPDYQVRALYASPTATVDVGALRGLVEQWRELAGRLRHEAKNETGEDVRYPLTSFAYATRLDFCADELAALIGEKA